MVVTFRPSFPRWQSQLAFLPLNGGLEDELAGRDSVLQDDILAEGCSSPEFWPWLVIPLNFMSFLALQYLGMPSHEPLVNFEFRLVLKNK